MDTEQTQAEPKQTEPQQVSEPKPTEPKQASETELLKEQLKEAHKKLSEIELSKKEQEKQQMEKQNEFEKLYKETQSELNKIKPVAESAIAFRDKQKAKLLERLGEDAPKFENLDIEQIESIVNLKMSNEPKDSFGNPKDKVKEPPRNGLHDGMKPQEKAKWAMKQNWLDKILN